MPTPVDYIIESIKASKKENINSKKRCVKHPCGICNSEVKNNDKSIMCTKCHFWIHIRCNGISVEDYKDFITRNENNPDLIVNEEWNCLNCTITERASIFPFGLESNYDLNCINFSNSMKFLKMIPEFEIASNVSKVNSSHDIDVNTVDTINCQYYTNDEFSKLVPTRNSFNIMHCNVDGYETHFDNLHHFFVEANKDFDVICISETSQQKN